MKLLLPSWRLYEAPEVFAPSLLWSAVNSFPIVSMSQQSGGHVRVCALVAYRRRRTPSTLHCSSLIQRTCRRQTSLTMLR